MKLDDLLPPSDTNGFCTFLRKSDDLKNEGTVLFIFTPPWTLRAQFVQLL
jgi:hypothetical protein